MNAVTDDVTKNVLLVEDERMLARTLSDLLRGQGYLVDACEDGAEALGIASEAPYDLILLDVMLPSMDGFDVCRGLRKLGVDTPILMLTARGQLGDKVSGLKSGADDYLTKPFEADELLARMEALIRRAATVNGGELRSYAFGGMKVDFIRKRILKEEELIELPDQESRLLQYFVLHRRQILSRDTLLREVWGYKAVPSTRTVDVHVAWLRQKIEPAPKTPRFIMTVHGQGYRFEG